MKLFRTKLAKSADIALGEDWDGPDQTQDSARDTRRKHRGLVTVNRSPLARKIITFNLIALIILVAGVLYLNPFRDGLVSQHEKAFANEGRLISSILKTQLRANGITDFLDGSKVMDTLEELDLPAGVEVFVFDPGLKLIAVTRSHADPVSTQVSGLQQNNHSTLITDFLNTVWEKVSGVLAPQVTNDPNAKVRALTQDLVVPAIRGKTRIRTTSSPTGATVFSVAMPIALNGAPIGAIAISSTNTEIDYLVRAEREQILQMFVIAILVSIGLSLVLASTIANPLADLAAAAELGRDRDARKLSPGRIRIPDMTARPDEIGRLSIALRGMVAALYDRIDANEQFAADVAHEIKNPLASLRSAVGSLRIIKKEEHREKLLDVVEHDVRRLDRLVSDISNASRLDSELVKEEEESFDLLKTVGNISDYLGQDAAKKGIELISDLPPDPIIVYGLEARLAQVFVNLITNAVSFCEEGDAIRIWARQRKNRILVVVEDTGPGIPDQALHKVFTRFYSERPPEHYGNNSGLGLSISKQIIEAHGGVIWAENIRPTDADVTSEPLGARFVVGLPL